MTLLNPHAGSPDIAIVLPCYNEELTIAGVIRQMRAALPQARIIVFDNNSADRSAELAKAEGADVRSVVLQGKGNVVRRMFADIDADIYLMVDADLTYDAATAQMLVAAIASGEADMAIGVRKGEKKSFPVGHRFGNIMFNLIVSRLFGRGMKDIFSGYRAFSRRFAKSFPAHAQGFDIETELSVYTLEQRVPFVEIDTVYGERPAGSVSKLHTIRDGWRILLTIVLLYKNLRPMMFFGVIATLMMLLSLALGIPVIVEWQETGLVHRMPTAMLASAIALYAGLMFVAGMILHVAARSYREVRHLHYLTFTQRWNHDRRAHS